MNLFSRLTFFLYLFQLENYHLKRFLKISRSRLFSFSYEKRQQLVWTSKAKILFSVSIIISLFIPLTFFFSFLNSSILFSLFSFLLTLVIFWLFFPLVLIFALLIIFPLDITLKKLIIDSAKKKILSFPNLKIIGITGSYGKTTMKETLFSVLSQKYRVAKTPDNKNTPLGIAEFIIKKLKPDTEIFIVEMGAYQKGDIKELCSLTKPNISILTGINESHLERFGSLKDTISTKFEIVENSHPNALIVLNADDPKIIANFKNYSHSRQVFFFSKNFNPLAKYRAEDISFFENGEGIQFSLKSQSLSLDSLKLKFLSDYIIGPVSASLLIARHLEMEVSEITKGLESAKPASHRLNLIKRDNNILIIDDSYNGNPNGAKEAIKVLSRFENKRKIFATPGLVEVGFESEKIHTELGRLLSSVADLVLLIKTPASDFIKKELLASNFSQEKIKEFSSMPELQDSLIGILREGDIILFQNDWPDNYM